MVPRCSLCLRTTNYIKENKKNHLCVPTKNKTKNKQNILLFSAQQAEISKKLKTLIPKN